VTANRRRLLSAIVTLLWAIILATAIGDACSRRGAKAQTRSELALLSARVCYLEASFRRDDCAALLNVARKRAGVRERFSSSSSWARQNGSKFDRLLNRYSALAAPTARARFIRAFPWGDVLTQPNAFNARWAELRSFVSRVLSGAQRDPCPHATQWGARYGLDKERADRAITAGLWLPARCAKSTANAFYAERR